MTINIGGLSNNGAINKTIQPQVLKVPSGFSSPGLYGGSDPRLTSPIGSPQTSQTTGNNPGMIPTPPKPDTTYTHTTTTKPGGGTSTKATPNPSVLAQQQAMNKLGAGLVEDGLAGPKTSEAIASGKYAGNGTPTAKDTSKTSGTTSGVMPKAETPAVKTPTPQPAPLNVAGQAPGVLSSGGQTGNEAQTQSRLQELSNNPIQGFTEKQARIDNLNNQITQLTNQFADKTGAIGGQGADLAYKTGEGASLQQQYNAKLNALTDQLNAETGQLGAWNTQQQTETTAGQGAYSGAQNQAGRATTAATNVLGQVAPITGVPYGTQTVQPGMLGQNGGQTGQVQQNDPYYKTLQNYAQMAAQGQYGAIPSTITGNPVLNDQMNQMAKGINPSYNPVTSAAQTNITSQQTGNVATMTAAYQSATNLGSQLNDLINTFGVNPNDVNAVNSAVSKIALNVSSPQYKALNNLVTDLVATYSSILTPGSSTDTARATAASLLDATAKGQSITETLRNLDEQAKAKIAGQTTGYGTTPSSSGGTTGGSYTSNSGNTYKLPY